ncbi:unnamed protein product [Allacma fusca]|uniref:Uncharacterized protein n=1 Tax=Allacma fusca TaxID=39272 RepID=A0A8J2KRM6_9HEXA|nr:unnamed protein product [Allacma fusca]
MAPRGRKKLKKNDNSMKGAQASDTDPSNSENYVDDEEHCPTISTLVSSIFLGSLRDVKLLKICRLVCKNWNSEASEALKTCSEVILEEKKSSFKNLTKLLLNRAVGPLHNLPSPFRDFHAKGSKFIDPTFISFCLNLSITTLSIDMSSNKFDQKQLHRVLVANKANIRILKFSGDADLDFKGSLSTDKTELTSLKQLEITDSCYECLHTELIEYILNRCKLEQLDLSIDGNDYVNNMLPQLQAESLKNLIIDFQYISTDTWDHLGSLRFLELRKLKFHLEDSEDIPNKDHQQWHSFCRSVSPSLEEFATNLPIPTAFDLTFPNLKSIEIVNNSYLSVFTPHRFPSLEKIACSFEMPLVRTVEIKDALAGTTKAMVTKYLERGLSVDRIPRRKSITDFMDLETITLDQNFVVDPDMILHCLPRVLKLREISLHWNGSLWAQLLRDSLGHLERIVVRNSAKQSKKTISELTQLLPNVWLR